jgi:hypothetical protein
VIFLRNVDFECEPSEFCIEEMIMIKIPEHIMQPGNQADFIPQEQCRPLNSAGIGYSVKQLLGGEFRRRESIICLY